jgi:hypothetical protein
MKKLFLLFLFLASDSTWAAMRAGTWTLSVNPELVDKKDSVKKSVLKFSSRSGNTWTYIPPAYPWGFYSSQETVLNGSLYFITFWSGGSRSVYYRVFQPDKLEVPVCEFETETEKPKLRFKNNQLQYLETVFSENQKRMGIWKKCSPHGDSAVKSKSPASVPTEKNKHFKKSKKQ